MRAKRNPPCGYLDNDILALGVPYRYEGAPRYLDFEALCLDPLTL